MYVRVCEGKEAVQSSHSVQREKKQQVPPMQMKKNETKKKKEKRKGTQKDTRNRHCTGGREGKKEKEKKKGTTASLNGDNSNSAD